MAGNAFIFAESALEKRPKTDTTADNSPQFLDYGQNFQWFFARKDIVWRNVVIFLYLHYAAFYGLFLAVFGYCKVVSIVFGLVYLMFATFGVTAGAHRLWAHRSYKATNKMRLLLIICNSMSFQNCVYEWVRDHRVHHKFVDTDADPHNVNRGFFFAHMGWLLVKKHPEVRNKGKLIDMSDLERDPFVMFQKRHYSKMMIFFTFGLPTLFACFVLGEQFTNAWYFCAVFRYMIQLHGTWLVNSAAHIWGMKPYDKTIKATDNIYVGAMAFGEGWHNYHHVFPWDYKTAELGNYRYNFTTAFIDFMANIKWAYDLKTVSDEVIRKRAARTGDGNNRYSRCVDPKLCNQNMKLSGTQDHLWGWDDPDMLQADKKIAKVLNKS